MFNERVQGAEVASLRRIGGALLIVAVTVLAYIPAMRSGYIWDDDSYLTHNPIIRDPAGLVKMWTSLTATPQFYPLVFSSFWVEARLWGFDPAGYHAVNVLLHATCSVLVWLVLARLRVPGAWAAGLIFALHPVHVESAAWITERKNVLSGVLYLLAALAYFRFDAVPERETPAQRRWGWYAAALASFALALTAKTVTCSLPAALGLMLWWKRERLRARDVWPLVPMFALGLAAAKVTVWVEQNHVLAREVNLGLTWMGRLALVGQAAAVYLWHLAWPADLVFMYPKWTVDPHAWWQWLPSAAWALVLIALWAMRGRIGKGPLIATLFFLGTLVPALGFIDVYPMRYTWVEDHFQYLADIGPIALACAAAATLVAHLGQRTLLVGGLATAAAAVLLGAWTVRQERIYKDAKTLWADTIERNPRAWMALNNMGKELLLEKKIDEAEPYFTRSIEIEPSPECMYNLAMVNLQRGKPLVALEYARRSAAGWRAKDDPQILVANCLWTLDREDEAVAVLREGVERLPRSPKMRVALAKALAIKRLPGARREAEEALRLDPQNREAAQLLSQVGVEP